jgi:hypothetical protein
MDINPWLRVTIRNISVYYVYPFSNDAKLGYKHGPVIPRRNTHKCFIKNAGSEGSSGTTDEALCCKKKVCVCVLIIWSTAK